MDAQGFGEPLVVAEDPDEVAEEDPEEDSMGLDNHVPFGFSPEPIDSEDFDLWDDPASD